MSIWIKYNEYACDHTKNGTFKLQTKLLLECIIKTKCGIKLNIKEIVKGLYHKYRTDFLINYSSYYLS